MAVDRRLKNRQEVGRSDRDLSKTANKTLSFVKDGWQFLDCSRGDDSS
jgi:hypothetical protein